MNWRTDFEVFSYRVNLRLALIENLSIRWCKRRRENPSVEGGWIERSPE
jgi:hypothetical protein